MPQIVPIDDMPDSLVPKPNTVPDTDLPDGFKPVKTLVQTPATQPVVSTPPPFNPGKSPLLLVYDQAEDGTRTMAPVDQHQREDGKPATPEDIKAQTDWLVKAKQYAIDHPQPKVDPLNNPTKTPDIYHAVESHAKAVQESLMKDPAFQQKSGEEKNKIYAIALNSQLQPMIDNAPMFVDAVMRKARDEQIKKVDFNQGAGGTAASSFSNKLNSAMSEIRQGLGSDPAVEEHLRQTETQDAINPQFPKTNMISGVAGGAVPLVGASMINPVAGAVVGGAQGVGSGREEGFKENYTNAQTAAISTERGVMNAILGLVPGGKAAAEVGAVRGAYDTLITVGRINVGQAALESAIKTKLGIQDDRIWEDVKSAATSGEGWAQAVMFAGIHGVTTALKNAGENPLVTENPIKKVGDVATAESLKVDSTKPVDNSATALLANQEVMKNLTPEAQAIVRKAAEGEAKAQAVEAEKVVQNPKVETPAPEVDPNKPLDVSEVGSGYSRQNLIEDMTKNGGQSPEVAKQTVSVLDAIANTWSKITGRHAEEFYPEHFDGLDKASEKVRTDPLNKDLKATVSFDPETGRAMLKAVNNPDAATFLHEGGHVVKRMLRSVDPATHKELDGWLNKALDADPSLGKRVAGDNASRPVQVEELFARTWERYFRDGKAPSPELKPTFQKMRTWLMDIYRQIVRKSSVLNVPIDDQFRKTMDGWLTADKGVVERAKVLNSVDAFGLRKTTPPVAAAKPEPRLPAELSKSTPNYGYQDKSFEVQFKSDVDKAIYIVTKARNSLTQSKGHEKFQEFLHSQGLSGKEINVRGKELRDELKLQAKSAPNDDTPLVLEQRAQKQEEEKTTDTSYESINKQRKLRGMLELIPGGDKTTEKKTLAEADANYTTEKAQGLISELSEKPRAITPTERGILAIHGAAIQTNSEILLRNLAKKGLRPAEGREIEGNLKEFQRQFDDLSTVIATSNSRAGQSLQAIKMDLQPKYDINTVLNRMKNAGNAGVKDVVVRQTNEMVSKLSDLEMRKAQHDADLQGEIDNLNAKAKSLGYDLKEVILRAEKRKGRFVTAQEASGLKQLIDKYDVLKMKLGMGDRFDYDIAKQKNKIDDKVSSLKPKTWLGVVAEPGNLARTLATSFDVSAPGRQGIGLVYSHPILALKATAKMFAAMSDFQAFKIERDLNDITKRPNADWYEKTNLLSKLEGYGDEEESFHSIVAKHIPGVALSQRSYTTFLNVLRADVFDSLAENYSKGIPSQKEANTIANFVKVFSGKGDLGKNQKALEAMNLVFWAPKLIMSRFQILTGQPLRLALKNGDPVATKMVLKEYSKFIVGASTVLGLAAAAGAKVETDPRSADFLKIRIGNTRIDPLGGLAQMTTFAGRFVTGQTKTAEGVIKPQDPIETMNRFARTKFSPILGTALDVKEGQNVVGDKTTALPTDWTSFKSISNSAPGMAIPMSLKDLVSSVEEQGVAKGTALGLVSAFGLGVQNYHPPIDDVLKDLPGMKNQDVESALTAFQQFKFNHPEIRQVAIDGGTEDDKAFANTMRRAEEMIRRNQDPTDLLKKELNVDASKKLGVAASIASRQKLNDLEPAQIVMLKKEIGDSAFQTLQNYDDTLAAWSQNYRIVDQLSEVVGAKKAREFLTSPSPEVLNAYKQLAGVKRTVKTQVDDNQRQMRSNFK